MCPRCEGMGTVTDIDVDELIDADKSLAEGAITVPGYTAGGWSVRQFTESGFLDPDKKIRDYTETERADFLYKEPTKVKITGLNITYEGLVPKITKSMLQKDRESMQPHIRAFVERAVVFTTCPECGGTRLNETARSSKIAEKNIADVSAMQITDLAQWLKGVDDPSVAPLVEGLQHTLDSFVEIGLGYLSLDRSSGTLSGGEAQRTKMIRHLSSSLTDITYVFDEPTVGLHPHDIAAHERRAPAPARQGQHGAGGRAQARGHRDRRPRRRPRARRRARRRRDHVHRQRRRPARLRHDDRAPSGRSRSAEARRPARPRARCPSAAPTSTTSATSTSTCRSGCSRW